MFLFICCFLADRHIFLLLHLQSYISFLPHPSSLFYSCVSLGSCHKNEENLSPSVQTTIDRAGTFRKTNFPLLSLLGIRVFVCVCTCACVCVLLMRLRGQVRNKPMPKRYPGSFINMSSSQCLLNQHEIQTNDVNNNN